jgi:hypothetical protein
LEDLPGVNSWIVLDTSEIHQSKSRICMSERWVWCVVANISREPHGEGESGEMRLGTRMFAPGAKVYCYPIIWHDGGERLRVLGMHRGSKKLITAVIARKMLSNWRVKQVFAPKVIGAMQDCLDSSEEAREKAEEMVKKICEA